MSGIEDMDRGASREVALKRFWFRAIEVIWGTVKVLLGIAFLFLLLWCSADVTSVSNNDQGTGPRLVEPDSTRPSHARVMESVTFLWLLTPDARGTLRVAFVPSTEINAASLGRGRFIVWEGVGDLSPEWIDAIMAHEIAHDVLRHGRDRRELDSVTDFAGEVLSLVFGGGPGSDERMKGWVDEVVVPTYSRAQESEADQRALELLRAVGYSRPDSILAGALRVLLNRYGDRGGGFFDSHPATSERIRQIEQTEQTNPN